MGMGGNGKPPQWEWELPALPRCVLGTKLLKNTNRKPYTINLWSMQQVSKIYEQWLTSRQPESKSSELVNTTTWKILCIRKIPLIPKWRIYFPKSIKKARAKSTKTGQTPTQPTNPTRPDQNRWPGDSVTRDLKGRFQHCLSYRVPFACPRKYRSNSFHQIKSNQSTFCKAP